MVKKPVFPIPYRLIIMKHFKKNLIFFLITVILLSPFQAIAESKEAEITNLILSKNRDKVFLSFTINNAFTENIIKLINSGLPITFSFDIKITKKRRLFPDKKIFERELVHKLRFSSLTKTFFINKPYASNYPYLIHSLESAKSEMTTITNLHIKGIEFEPGAEYKVETRAMLREVTLPFYMHKILFFLSLWDFKTDWTSLNIKF